METSCLQDNGAVLTESPLTRLLLAAQSPDEVVDDVSALFGDVLTEQSQDDSVPGFHAAVTAPDAVPAEHDEVGAQIVSRVLEYVMQAQPDPVEAPRKSDGEAEGAVRPLAMKLAQNVCVLDPGFGLRVD